jgi:acetyl-CoA C-acetyltransferase
MRVVIAGYARSPFSKFVGRFAGVPAVELGAHAVRAALARAGVEGADVQRVFAGQVLLGGAGQNPSRQTAVAAGIPLTTPATTINIVCLSGMEAAVAAARLIAAGEVDIAVAVGQESMSLAPHAWVGSRTGTKYGAIEMLDLLERDGLVDAFDHEPMGANTEAGNSRLGIGRAVQDEWSALSHRRAAGSAAWLAQEIEPYRLETRKGAVLVADDDGVRPDTDVATLARLRPAFARERGTITAGNASQITDGAAALVLMSMEAAEARGIGPLAEIVSHGLVAGPDTTLHSQPSNAIRAALAKTDIAPEDLGAVEINEAFAAVAIHSAKELGIPDDRVNAHGGAIALGHPIGASGARVIGTLARQLQDVGAGTLGAAALCGGGGQGSAVVLRAL